MTFPLHPTDDSARSYRARLQHFLSGTGGQFVRYAITGFGITAVSAALYWVLATPFGIHAQIANLIGYLVAVALGYVLHSRWSFRGHGRRDSTARTTLRFLVASFVSLAMNSAWIWLLVHRLGGPTWWPIVPILFVTPVAMFWLNRLWVFE